MLPLLLACGARGERPVPDDGQAAPDLPADVPGAVDPAPTGDDDAADPALVPEGMNAELPLVPEPDPTAQPEPPPAEPPPPAVCSQPAPPLEGFDCGDQAILFENNGPPANRVNYVILGDGYTADMLDTVYPEHIQNMLTGTAQSMFTQLGEPYLRYRKFINICALKIASNEACIDDDDTGQQCDTFFDTSGDDPSRLARLPQSSFARVQSAIAESLPEDTDVDWIAITVNAGANNWWNSGGRFMLWNGSYQPRGRSASVALHEGGHAFHGLADEYGGDSCGNRNANQPNVTSDPTGAKWQVWLGFDHGPGNPEATGAVGTGVQGAFEGALYCNTNYYRPSDDSQMNILPEPFNMPSIDKIVRDIYEIVDPIDEHTGNEEPLLNPAELRVRLVDPAVLKVDWSVDGSIVSAGGGECFDATQIAAGEHVVTAHVYDDTPWVRSDRSDLEQTVSWTVRVQSDAPAPE